MNADQIARSLSGHKLRNLELQENLIRKGVVLDDPQAIELHFWSAEQRDATLLGRALYQCGFLILVLAPHEQENGSVIWNVEAGIKEPISRIVTPDFTERMVRLAADHSSEYDGWGTSP